MKNFIALNHAKLRFLSKLYDKFMEEFTGKFVSLSLQISYTYIELEVLSQNGLKNLKYKISVIFDFRTNPNACRKLLRMYQKNKKHKQHTMSSVTSISKALFHPSSY